MPRTDELLVRDDLPVHPANVVLFSVLVAYDDAIASAFARVRMGFDVIDRRRNKPLRYLRGVRPNRVDPFRRGVEPPLEGEGWFGCKGRAGGYGSSSTKVARLSSRSVQKC
jgi:hypothetical protein